MKKIFKKYLQQTLAAVALIFLGIVAAYYIWGITTISFDVNQVTTAIPANASSSVFDIQDAKNLNLKGLMTSP